MKILFILSLSMACLFLSNIFACSDSNCSYERKDTKNGTIMHFDRYGKLLGRTKL